MYTYLELLSTKEKGLTYRARPSLRVGSSGDCDVQVNDPKIPPIHSQVLLDNKNRMVLVCTNAVYEIIINGRGVKKVVLLNGITIRIGNSFFKVIATDRELMGALDPLMPKPEPDNAARNWFEEDRDVATTIKFAQPESPKTILAKELKQLVSEFKNPPLTPTFRLFKFPILLRLETGPQADDEYILSWGPRNFGPLALEFPVEFPPFPGILFTLSPSDSGEIIFSTKHPDFARVSGHTDPTCVIRDGDKIEAGNSTILVEFLKDVVGHDQN